MIPSVQLFLGKLEFASAKAFKIFHHSCLKL
jgi:hypothetical protein